jgi:hypothetical protein
LMVAFCAKHVMVRQVNSQQSFMRSERRMDNEMTVTTFYEGRNKRAESGIPELGY